MKENKKKKLNKKLVIPLLVIFGIALVSAISYYAMFSVTLNVHQPISITGELEQSVNCNSGETCEGSKIKISNDGDTPRIVKIVENGNEDIKVNYINKLYLTKKDSSWTPIGEQTEVVYTLVGEEFDYTANLPEGYVLIYAKDHQDRFNNPSEFILANEIGSIPEEDDWNVGDEADYSQAPDYYEHKKGAKLWAVPSSDLNSDGTLTWVNMNDYLWETDLVYYFDNSNNELTIPANSFIEFYPVFNPDAHLESGEYQFSFEIQ